MRKSIYPLVAVAALAVVALWAEQASAQVYVRVGGGYPAYGYAAPVYSYNTAYVPAYTYDYGYSYPAYSYGYGYGYRPYYSGYYSPGVSVRIGGYGGYRGYYGGYRGYYGGYRGYRGWRW